MYLPSIVTFRKPVLKLSVSIRSGHIFDAVALPPKNTSMAFLSWYSLSPHGQCKHQWAHLDVTMGVYISCEYGCHYGMLSLSWRRLKKKGKVLLTLGEDVPFNTQLRIVREQWEKSSKRKRLRAGKENICKWWCSSLSQMTFIHAVITCAVMEAAMTDQTSSTLELLSLFFWVSERRNRTSQVILRN